MKIIYLFNKRYLEQNIVQFLFDHGSATYSEIDEYIRHKPDLTNIKLCAMLDMNGIVNWLRPFLKLVI